MSFARAGRSGRPPEAGGTRAAFSMRRKASAGPAVVRQRDRRRIRALVRRGSRDDRGPQVVAKAPAFQDPTVCEGCAAVYSRKTWRRGRRMSSRALARAARADCPACRQVRRREFFGRVVARGSFVLAHRDAVLHRVANVAERAGFTQPERRLVEIRWQSPDAVEVLTTSQKLAHRIVHELRKAFGGRSAYSWSDRDGGLFATWERDEPRRHLRSR